MSKKFYVTTKLFVGGRRLIGILSEVDGQFRFEYKLGDKQRESFCYLDEFPDQDKIYVGAEVENFVYGIIPRRSDRFVNEFLKAANLKEYDVWGLLKYNASMSRFSVREAGLLHEQLPEGTIVYEDLERD